MITNHRHDNEGQTDDAEDGTKTKNPREERPPRVNNFKPAGELRLRYLAGALVAAALVEGVAGGVDMFSSCLQPAKNANKGRSIRIFFICLSSTVCGLECSGH